MVGIISRSMAQEMASRLRLKTFEVPIREPADKCHMGRHRDDSEKPAVSWLRETIESNERARPPDSSVDYSADQ